MTIVVIILFHKWKFVSALGLFQFLGLKRGKQFYIKWKGVNKYCDASVQNNGQPLVN